MSKFGHPPNLDYPFSKCKTPTSQETKTWGSNLDQPTTLIWLTLISTKRLYTLVTTGHHYGHIQSLGSRWTAPGSKWSHLHPQSPKVGQAGLISAQSRTALFPRLDPHQVRVGGRYTMGQFQLQTFPTDRFRARTVYWNPNQGPPLAQIFKSRP